MQQISDRLIQSYALSPERRHALYRRTLVVVIFSQIFGGAGLAAGVTVGALLAQQMLGTAGLAGLPSANLKPLPTRQPGLALKDYCRPS